MGRPVRAAFGQRLGAAVGPQRARNYPFLWSFPATDLRRHLGSATTATSRPRPTTTKVGGPDVGPTRPSGSSIRTSASSRVIAGSGFFRALLKRSQPCRCIGGPFALSAQRRGPHRLRPQRIHAVERRPGRNRRSCVVGIYGCTKLKIALQAAPVATGPSDSRFIGATYIGDLDGNVWRFEIDLDAATTRDFRRRPIKLASLGDGMPIFASMATVSVGPRSILFFGTGSDRLPTAGEHALQAGGRRRQRRQRHHLVPDHVGPGGMASATTRSSARFRRLPATSSSSRRRRSSRRTPCDAGREPACADILSAAPPTTATPIPTPRWAPRSHRELTTLLAAGRATAPFIVYQHLVFGAGNSIQVFGEANDYKHSRPRRRAHPRGGICGDARRTATSSTGSRGAPGVGDSRQDGPFEQVGVPGVRRGKAEVGRLFCRNYMSPVVCASSNSFVVLLAASASPTRDSRLPPTPGRKRPGASKSDILEGHHQTRISRQVDRDRAGDSCPRGSTLCQLHAGTRRRGLRRKARR